MAQISGAVTSVAQTQVAQSRQAGEADAARQATGREARRALLRQEEAHEFVQDMAEATGLKVDTESGHDSERKRKKRHTPEELPADADAAPDARLQAAALLATPEAPDKLSPPPCIIDIEA